MNAPVETWEEMPPIPWEPDEVWLGSCPIVTKYLLDAFEKAFGERPVEVDYAHFPDGHSARLQIQGKLEDDHNIWGMRMYSKLRRSGLDLAVVVRSSHWEPMPVPRAAFATA